MKTLQRRQIHAVDLFCGAGGTSKGIMDACKEADIEINLLAINHWPVAVNSHKLNHPSVRHRCESLETVRPTDAVPGRRVGLLGASPECTHFSQAAGGRPRNEQSRATAWVINRWAADLEIDNILMENVREFKNWGPLYNDHSNGCRGLGTCLKRCHYSKPIPERKGETFRAFIQSLESMGYRVEHRIQCAADFGDPTSRKRLIIMARRGGRAINWPEPTHGAGRKPYRTARECIDWDLKGNSIFKRKKPLSKNSLRRIMAGFKFQGESAEPFLIKLYGTGMFASVDAPLPTITAGGNHFGLVQPFLIHTCHEGGARVHSVDEPIPTITAGNRGEMALVEPFLIQTDQTGGNGHCVRSLDAPLPTIVTKQNLALIQPFLTKYYGTAGARPVDEPIDTITARDRFALVEPREGADGIDILFRMLQPHELQAGMSFPKDYKFYGNREEQVRQIGNAVPVQLAKAHALALLTN